MKIGFGFMRLPFAGSWDNIDFGKTKNLVDYAMENGINHFDTGISYHSGLSETAIRKCVVERYKRSLFEISDKLPLFCTPYEKTFNKQLEECGVDYFDYYLLHGIGRGDSEKGFEFIKQKKEEGKIKKIGFSFHDTADVLEKILSKHPETEIVLLQLNFVDWENKGIQAKKCYEIAKYHKVEIWAMEGLKGGRILNLKSEALKSHTMPEWAYGFLKHLNIEKMLCGFNDTDQISDNIKIAKEFKLTEKEVNELLSISECMNEECTGCNYCKVCPEKIDIPAIFALYSNARSFNEASTIEPYKNQRKDCKECGKCEEVCPQKINIRKRLKDIKEYYKEFD